MTVTDRIEVNPKIMMGKPVIRGTRVTVELILRKLGEGATEAEFWTPIRRSRRKTSRLRWPTPPTPLAHEETLLLKNQG